MSKALGHTPKSGAKATGDSRKSAAQNTSVGSGSRPGAAKVHIETTAPTDHHHIRKPPSGYLK